jgi:hypothetical protein
VIGYLYSRKYCSWFAPAEDRGRSCLDSTLLWDQNDTSVEVEA